MTRQQMIDHGVADEFLLKLHSSHDCNIGPCVCICGCTEGGGCRYLFGPLCSVCTVRRNRGDEDHDVRAGWDEVPE